jgi:CheY-like chemotaxis protein
LFDCVFLDIVMPAITGDRLARRLRSQGFNAPLVAVTGNVAPSDVRLYARSGFSAVLGKPLEKDALMNLARLTKIL